MSAEVAYLDTSAAVKLLMTERESPALRRWLRRRPERASAALVRVELVRVVRRAGVPRLIPDARKLLAGIHLIRLDDVLLDRAADLDPIEPQPARFAQNARIPRP
ncbi:MAG: PIN domain-containing protein [Chloroflexi bacterium]|nr:MAG: PIN domain-containing protein [Chloroflexota bacterium]